MTGSFFETMTFLTAYHLYTVVTQVWGAKYTEKQLRGKNSDFFFGRRKLNYYEMEFPVSHGVRL